MLLHFGQNAAFCVSGCPMILEERREMTLLAIPLVLVGVALGFSASFLVRR
jgi:hypothetical protein